MDARTFRLERVGDKLRRMGYDEPALVVVIKNDRALICKMPGFSRNHSGIRGMRDDHYTASEMRAYEVISQNSNWIDVREIIVWPTSPEKDKGYKHGSANARDYQGHAPERLCPLHD